MGFFIRKSFSLGPLRLNLSKSGIGTSVGVKGFRIGTKPSGQTYLHAGRGGIYYRENLGEAVASPPPPQVDLSDTSTNISPPASLEFERNADKHRVHTPLKSFLIGIALVVVGLVALVLFAALTAR